MRSMTFFPKTLKPVKFYDREARDTKTKTGVVRRVGHPRPKWVETTLEKIWKLIGQTIAPLYKYTTLNLDNINHICTIHRAAKIDLYTTHFEREKTAPPTATTTTAATTAIATAIATDIPTDTRNSAHSAAEASTKQRTEAELVAVFQQCLGGR